MSGHVNVRIRCVKKAFINNMKKELIFLTSRTLAVINILQLEGCFIVSNVHACKGLQKSICELER